MKTLIEIQGLTFAWLKPDAPEKHEERSHLDLDIIFDDLSLEIPSGLVSVLGPNGVGKSTLLLLLGARLFPHEGTILLGDLDTKHFANAHRDAELEDQRNRLASFVYQNMEFETDMNLGSILASIALHCDAKRKLWIDMLPEGLALNSFLEKRPQDMAKGELQKAVIAMALAYGSPLVIMDEPVFALEDSAKHSVFAFIREFARACDINIIFTAHDFELCRDYADFSLLLWREEANLHYEIGPAMEICSQEKLEKAYHAPLSTLYQKERLYRSMLLEGRRT